MQKPLESAKTAKKLGSSEYQTSSVIGGGHIMEDKGNLTVQNPSGRQALCPKPCHLKKNSGNKNILSMHWKFKVC